MEPCTPNSRELSIVNGARDYGSTVSKIPEVHARILSGHGGSIPSWGRTGKVKDTETCDVRLIGQIGASEREEYRTRERACVALLERRPRPKGKLGYPATFHTLRWGWGPARSNGYGKICHYAQRCAPIRSEPAALTHTVGSVQDIQGTPCPYQDERFAWDGCRFRLNLPTWLGPISAAILRGMGRGILSAGLVVGA